MATNPKKKKKNQQEPTIMLTSGIYQKRQQ